MKSQLLVAAGLVFALATAGAAQTTETKSETRVKVKDGKNMTMTGCVERNAGGSFMLTHVSSRAGALGNYMLTDADADDLEKHVGHRVEIEGKAADKDDDGKIETKTRTKVKVGGGDTQKTEAKTEVKGNLKGLPFLGVKSVKMIAATCP